MRTGRGARGRLAVALAIVSLLIAGCRDGGSDVDVDEGARALEEAALAVLTDIAPDAEVTVDVEVRPCIDALNRDTGESVAELGGGSGAVGGDLGETPVEGVAERIRQALVAHGFEIDPDYPGLWIAGEREDGIRLAVIAQPPVDAVGASGTTGCRPRT